MSLNETYATSSSVLGDYREVATAFDSLAAVSDQLAVPGCILAARNGVTPDAFKVYTDGF